MNVIQIQACQFKFIAKNYGPNLNFYPTKKPYAKIIKKLRILKVVTGIKVSNRVNKSKRNKLLSGSKQTLALLDNFSARPSPQNCRQSAFGSHK